MIAQASAPTGELTLGQRLRLYAAIAHDSATVTLVLDRRTALVLAELADHAESLEDLLRDAQAQAAGRFAREARQDAILERQSWRFMAIATICAALSMPGF